MAGKYGLSVKQKFDGKIYQYYSGYFQKAEAKETRTHLKAMGYNVRILETDNGIDRPYSVFIRKRDT